jgi:hypothetical protein
MKAVTDTGPLIWIERIGYGPELHRVYSTVWTPPSVEAELQDNWKNTAVVWKGVTPYVFGSERERKRFDRIVNRWIRKEEYSEDERADVETIVLCREFAKADDALYANQEAEQTFGNYGDWKYGKPSYGSLKDLYQIHERAIENGVWTPRDAEKFIVALIDADYRTPFLKKFLGKFRKKNKL